MVASSHSKQFKQSQQCTVCLHEYIAKIPDFEFWAFLENLCTITMREPHFGGFCGLKKVFLSSYFWLFCPVFHKFPHFHKGNFTKYEKYPVCAECHSFWAPKSLLPRGNKSSDAFLTVTLHANWIHSKKCPFFINSLRETKRSTMSPMKNRKRAFFGFKMKFGMYIDHTRQNSRIPRLREGGKGRGKISAFLDYF